MYKLNWYFDSKFDYFEFYSRFQKFFLKYVIFIIINK